MGRKVKTLSERNAAKPGRAPLHAALEAMEERTAKTFREVETTYLDAMQEFDGLVADGIADEGDRRNGKGDFFNDMIALLLANASGKDLHSRPSVPGLSFETHKLDVAYPAKGEVELVVETKASGIPKHAGNTRQKKAEGRPGSADLEKRIKEASFKNIDIKAEQARIAGDGGGPTSDLGYWISHAPPRCYMFMAVRVIDEADLRRAVKYGHTANTWFNACGLYCYGWDPGQTAMRRSRSAPPAWSSIEFSRAFRPHSGICRSPVPSSSRRKERDVSVRMLRDGRGPHVSRL